MLRRMCPIYWDKLFKEYVGNSIDPSAWLYEILKPSGDLLTWNFIAYDNLVENRPLDSYAQDVLGLELSNEIIQDLAQISGFQKDRVFQKDIIICHPFLRAAEKWWDKN